MTQVSSIDVDAFVFPIEILEDELKECVEQLGGERVALSNTSLNFEISSIIFKSDARARIGLSRNVHQILGLRRFAIFTGQSRN